jgi:hypothetical protein
MRDALRVGVVQARSLEAPVMVLEVAEGSVDCEVVRECRRCTPS